MMRVLLVVIFLIAITPMIAFAADRIELDSTAIQGSRELPKVLYIVPWKSSRLGALSNGAGSSSFDVTWDVLDRDVFRRQVGYYGMLYGEGVK
ncbi:MAG: hypothetical protein COB30_009215 [Ectothiorhodospiraceae bacterium]|nr:hypothetical protein [Ectothiorhodospiraceae bacterium]